ncbi:dihydrofolate reductase family protein [Clavibacter michiganensis]|uniref:dihydrofolate reductase family protein n=1 Tax=Clavibacter michiganensis TaxID=28447 RepID=UPI0013667C44|nr:dihydrofolate reductase family protein [Clavibacter michiganensis]MDO4045191.1 dihydrofolate reductase family protein [Clavibacter michiganensis]MDO4054015.1 dihydrofolate reductase family protein [Clavibacter michiganensis]MDO4057906.1 dihydrofolate reductase family protein [Clavibacter michiganensis]MDO4066456.1 dihydrofolate reductase family protein [Clavibacter michiganensis]MDO4069652.1 dihydrofolate reductase family protein [Clavibacter michiganensis]
MRRITAGLFASVDGVVEAPNLFQFDSFDAELGAGMTRLMETVTTAVLGRHGYEEWSSYWPQAPADDAFGAFINPIEKLVASTTLTGELAWNATLIEGDVVDALADLKRTDGGDIGVFASISLARELLFAGVLDELTLMIHPVVAGAGRRLFEPSDPVTRLELRRSEITSAGNALLTYALRDGGS